MHDEVLHLGVVALVQAGLRLLELPLLDLVVAEALLEQPVQDAHDAQHQHEEHRGVGVGEVQRLDDERGGDDQHVEQHERR